MGDEEEPVVRHLYWSDVQGREAHAQRMPGPAAEDGRVVHAPALCARVPLGCGHEIGQLQAVDLSVVHGQERQRHSG